VQDSQLHPLRTFEPCCHEARTEPRKQSAAAYFVTAGEPSRIVRYRFATGDGAVVGNPKTTDRGSVAD